jgi:hypothetical protein
VKEKYIFSDEMSNICTFTINWSLKVKQINKTKPKSDVLRTENKKPRDLSQITISESFWKDRGAARKG